MMLKRALILLIENKGPALLCHKTKYFFAICHVSRAPFAVVKKTNKFKEQIQTEGLPDGKEEPDNLDIMSHCSAIVNVDNRRVSQKIGYLKTLLRKLKNFESRNEPVLVSCLQEMQMNLHQCNISGLSIQDNAVISENYLRLIELKVVRPQKYWEQGLHQNFINRIVAEGVEGVSLRRLAEYYSVYSKFMLSKQGLHLVISDAILGRLGNREESKQIDFMVLQALLVGFRYRYSLSKRQVALLKRVCELVSQLYHNFSSGEKVRAVELLLCLGKVYNSLKAKIQVDVFRRFGQDVLNDRIAMSQVTASLLMDAVFYNSQSVQDISRIIVQKLVGQIDLKLKYSQSKYQGLMDVVLSYSRKNKFGTLALPIQTKFMRILQMMFGLSPGVSVQNNFADMVDSNFFQDDRGTLEQLISGLESKTVSYKLLYVCSKRSLVLNSNHFACYESILGKFNSQQQYSASKEDYLTMTFVLLALNHQKNNQRSSQAQKMDNTFKKFSKLFQDVSKGSNYRSFLFYLEDCEPRILDELINTLNFDLICSLILNQLDEPTFPQLFAYKYLTLHLKSKRLLLPQKDIVSVTDHKLLYFLLRKEIEGRKCEGSIAAVLLSICKYQLQIVLSSTKEKTKVAHGNLVLAHTIFDYLEHLTCVFLQSIDAHCQQLYFYAYWSCMMSIGKYFSGLADHPSLYCKFCNMVYFLLNSSRLGQIQPFNSFLVTVLIHLKGMYPNDLIARLIVANLYRKGNIGSKDYQTYLPMVLEASSSVLIETREVIKYLLCSQGEKQQLAPKTIVAAMMNPFILPSKDVIAKDIGAPSILAKAISFFSASLDMSNYGQRLYAFQKIVCAFITQFDQQMLWKINLVYVVENLKEYCSGFTEATSKEVLIWLQSVMVYHFKHFHNYQMEYHIDLLNAVCEMTVISRSYLERIFDQVISLQSDVNTKDLRLRAIGLLVKTDFQFDSAQMESVTRNVLLRYKSQAMFVYLQMEPWLSVDQKDRALKCIFDQYNKNDKLPHLINNQLVHAYLREHYGKIYSGTFLEKAEASINRNTADLSFVQVLTDEISMVVSKLGDKSGKKGKICMISGFECFSYKQLLIFRSSSHYYPSNYSLCLLQRLLANMAKVLPQQIVIIAKYDRYLDKGKDNAGWRVHSINSSTAVAQLKEEMGLPH